MKNLLSGQRYNGLEIGHFYDRRKRAKGAAKARVAVARKLLVVVCHILKDGECYRYNSLTTFHLGKPALVPGHAE
jgi:hypothetical protein